MMDKGWITSDLLPVRRFLFDNGDPDRLSMVRVAELRCTPGRVGTTGWGRGGRAHGGWEPHVEGGKGRRGSFRYKRDRGDKGQGCSQMGRKEARLMGKGGSAPGQKK